MGENDFSRLVDELETLLNKYNATITMDYDMRTEERSICLEMKLDKGIYTSLNQTSFP